MNSDITYDEFLEKVQRNHAQIGGSWRLGQTYFHTLSHHRPEVAEQIRSTLHDPFHHDEVSEETHKFVRLRW